MIKIKKLMENIKKNKIPMIMLIAGLAVGPYVPPAAAPAIMAIIQKVIADDPQKKDGDTDPAAVDFMCELLLK